MVVVKEEKVKVEPKKIEVKRTKTAWLPCSLLYEKMNIAEPSGGYICSCYSQIFNFFNNYILYRSHKKGKKSSGNFSLFQCLSETTKNRKKTHRERPDFPDVFTKAREADIDLLNTNANVLPLPSTLSSTSTNLPEVRVQSVSTISPSPSVPSTSSILKSKPVDIPVTKNKSDLELKSLSMEAKHPSEKKDLFKAIFDSDDDEEDTTTEAKSNDALIGSQSTIPTGNDFLSKPATILNVLRNSSPPRGIFSNMFKTTTEIVAKAPVMNSTSETSLAEKSKINLDIAIPSVPPTLLYGPTLPANNKEILSSSIQVIPGSSTSIDTSRFVHDEWIEKSRVDDKDVKIKDKKKHKKVKKHKKEKSKKKKSNKDKSR